MGLKENNLASKISKKNNLALPQNLVTTKKLQMFPFELKFQNVAGFWGQRTPDPPYLI